jgi:hypothetical protein
MVSRVPAAVALALLLAGCRSCRGCEDAEESEARDQARDHIWRSQIRIVGRGRVHTFVPAFDCADDGAGAHGACGPLLLRFKELAPPTMQAVAATGWVFDHWESEIRDPDGAVRPRAGRMPDGPLYLNGFGYEDTGELEIVTAVFVPGG